jgi:putative selenium metabolism hydrolase
MEALIAFTQRLLRQRSLSGLEGAVVAIVADEMRALGFDRVWIERDGSAVGLVEGRRPGPRILLDSHCDVVDANPADWRHDPFGAEIDGDRLYGRGSMDTKGNLAAMAYAAAALDRERLAGSVAVCASLSEEVVEGGSLKVLMDALHPDYVVIGEGTELELSHGGRGRAEIVIETIGRSAHSSSPHAGLCAVHQMMRLMATLEAQPLPVDPLLGPALLALTEIISEPYPGRSTIPYRCRVTYDRRLIANESAAGVLAGIRACPGLDGIEFNLSLQEGTEQTYTGLSLAGLKFYPAWALPEDHPFVQAALVGLRRAGLNPALRTFRFCTNAAYSAGVAGVPTVGFGLGAETEAHTVDESVSLADLTAAMQGYKSIIEAVLAS